MAETDAQHSSESQFVGLLTASQLSLMMYVRGLMPGDPAASDVVQEVNAKLWQKRTDFALGTNFKAWAFSIARFEVLTYRKQQSRDARLQFSDDLQQTIAEELELQEDNFLQQHEALQLCLQRLKDSDRELVLHRYSGGATLAAYANQIGRSVGGLKVALHRLRSALAECIQQRLNAEGGAS